MCVLPWETKHPARGVDPKDIVTRLQEWRHSCSFSDHTPVISSLTNIVPFLGGRASVPNLDEVRMIRAEAGNVCGNAAMRSPPYTPQLCTPYTPAAQSQIGGSGSGVLKGIKTFKKSRNKYHCQTIPKLLTDMIFVKKNYTTRFSSQQFYTVKVHNLRNCSLTTK